MDNTLNDSLLLSVSVAAYNAERYIDECLDSFADNSFAGKLEVLVIDDGGTDSTLNHVSKYASKYPGIYRPIHKENGGWGSVINYAINEAKGKYYKHVDADDYFNKQSVYKLLSDLEKIDVDVVFTPYMQFYDDTREIVNVNKVNDKLMLNKVINIKEFYENANSINMHSCCFKTKMLKDSGIRLLEHHFYTDAELFIKCLGVSKSAYLVDYIVYCYRFGRSGQSCSEEGIRKHYKELKDVIDSLIIYNEKNVTNPINKSIVKKYIEEEVVGYMIMCGIAKDYDELKSTYDRAVNSYRIDSNNLGRYRLYNKLRWKFIPILDFIFELRAKIKKKIHKQKFK